MKFWVGVRFFQAERTANHAARRLAG